MPSVLVTANVTGDNLAIENLQDKLPDHELIFMCRSLREITSEILTYPWQEEFFDHCQNVLATATWRGSGVAGVIRDTEYFAMSRLEWVQYHRHRFVKLFLQSQMEPASEGREQLIRWDPHKLMWIGIGCELQTVSR